MAESWCNLWPNLKAIIVGHYLDRPSIRPFVSSNKAQLVLTHALKIVNVVNDLVSHQNFMAIYFD